MKLTIGEDDIRPYEHKAAKLVSINNTNKELENLLPYLIGKEGIIKLDIEKFTGYILTMLEISFEDIGYMRLFLNKGNVIEINEKIMKEKIIEINGQKFTGNVVENYDNGEPKEIIFDGIQKINSPIGELECKKSISFYKNGNLKKIMIVKQINENTNIKQEQMGQVYTFDEIGKVKEIGWVL